jgi:hypothetical protein
MAPFSYYAVIIANGQFLVNRVKVLDFAGDLEQNLLN